KNELFWNKVRESQLSESFAAVRLARAHLASVLRAFAAPVMEASLQAGDPARARPVLHADEHNNALWMRVPAGAAAAVRARVKELGGIHPLDRFGKPEPGEYSTPEVEAALQTYRFVCHAASRAVADQLRALAGDLQPRLAALTSAATLALVAVALERHVSEALRLGWCFPELVHGVSASGCASEEQGGGEGMGDETPTPGSRDEAPTPGSTPLPGSENDLSFQGLWPYWLDGRAASTVPASFDLSGAFLLTGPNMAGKSTTLRSTAAAALLGSCGLMVPAARARLPYLDAIMLRNFSADAPLEGRSSFAVEMTEVRYVLEDVSPRSLVLVDELCRGTEVQAGSALAGAFVERLDASGCRAVFATHLHALLDLPLRLRNTRRMRMEVLQGPDGRLRPTLRMLPGECTQSLALEVARDSG
ncbi:MutS domain V, partial [Helicosporidium sp. ATCC 50920]